MTRARDIYGDQHGPRYSAETREEAIEAIKTIYPSAIIEASAGMMFTVWVDGVNVGSGWERRNRKWFYRVGKL